MTKPFKDEKASDQSDEEEITSDELDYHDVPRDEHFQLRRSDSLNTQYTDFLDDTLGDISQDLKNAYRSEVVASPDENKLRVKEEISQLKAERKTLTKKQKAETKAEYNIQKKALTRKMMSSKDVELEAGNYPDGRVHLFRGKNLTSTTTDRETGEQRFRNKDEVEEYITRDFRGRPVLSDALELEKVDDERVAKIRNNVKGHFDKMKAGGSTALFNAGKAYSKAVGELMRETESSGNTVVATSKFPWVASEYAVGQMGGASGDGRGSMVGDRKDDRHPVVGYDRRGKPVGRVLANQFAISMTTEEYRQLRLEGDLIDVNVDVQRGIKPNQKIEEVTFNSLIPGKNVVGSLPMILPRFDRKWEEMDVRKKEQYSRIFGFDETKYREMQEKFGDDDYNIGAVVEHLISHNGNLLRDMAIARDRFEGYEGSFVVPYAESYHGAINSLNQENGDDLAKRQARLTKIERRAKYVEDRHSFYAQHGRISSGVFYADDEVNFLIGASINPDVTYIEPAVVAVRGGLSEAIHNFVHNGGGQAIAVIAQDNHFTFLHMTVGEDGAEISYIDPMGSDEVPLNIRQEINESVLSGQNIKISQTVIQPRDEDGLAVNNDCGAFVVDLATKMSYGAIQINEDGILFSYSEEHDQMIMVEDFDEKRSNGFGERLRVDHRNIICDIALYENRVMEEGYSQPDVLEDEEEMEVSEEDLSRSDSLEVNLSDEELEAVSEAVRSIRRANELADEDRQDHFHEKRAKTENFR